MTDQRIFNENELADMVKALYRGEVADKIDTVKKFRKLLRECKQKGNNSSIEEIIQTGIVPKFVEFLQIEDNPSLQSETAKVLTEFVSGTTEQTKAIIDAGAVPFLIQLLSSRVEDVQQQVIWVLGNIAGDCPEYRDLLLEQGLVDPLLMLLDKPQNKTVLWAVCNLCRGKTPPPDHEKISRFLEPLGRLLASQKDCDILDDTCWAIAYLCDGSTEIILQLIASGIHKKIIELLMNDSPRVVIASLRVAGSIAMGNDDQVQELINCKILPNLLLLLNVRTEAIRRNACWITSNITAGNQSHRKAVIGSGIIPVLIDILGSPNSRTKKEAASALVNVIVLGTPDQIEYLVRKGCIPPLCDLLTDLDDKIIPIALDGLNYILHLGEIEAKDNGGNNIYLSMIEDCYGVEKFEYLQFSKNDNICQHAYFLLTRYFYFDAPSEEENFDDVSEEQSESKAGEGDVSPGR